MQILTVPYEYRIGFRPDPPLPARVGYARLYPCPHGTDQALRPLPPSQLFWEEGSGPVDDFMGIVIIHRCTYINCSVHLHAYIG